MDTVAESTRAVKSLQRRRPAILQVVLPRDPLPVPHPAPLRATAPVMPVASRAAPFWRESAPLSEA
jgi:hypothetical protein